MMDGVLDLPAHVLERLASALETNMIGIAPSATALRSALGADAPVETVVRSLAEAERLGLSAPAAGSWVRSLLKAAARQPRPDLVWSGPEMGALQARHTGRVYDELLGAAQRSLWLSTYAFFDGPRAFEVLARRMDAVPALRVTLLLNIQRRRGDTTVSDQLVRRFAEKLWRSDWPGHAHPRVFYDPRALESDTPGGVLHAKAVVADEEDVFITSANLTEAAQERNVELGVLVRDRALAANVTAHFAGLIDRGALRALPDA